MVYGRGTRPALSKRLAGKTVPAPGAVLRSGMSRGNPAGLAAVSAGRAFLARHRLNVGVVQRGCRPEAVEHDSDRARVTARADAGPFPAGKIWASCRAECAHPD